jgi:hypothetical protein
MTYVLLTRAPLYWGRSPFSLDLHVLGAPLTFVLSQDQTLQLNPVLAKVSYTARVRSCVSAAALFLSKGALDLPRAASPHPSERATSALMRFAHCLLQTPKGREGQGPAISIAGIGLSFQGPRGGSGAVPRGAFSRRGPLPCQKQFLEKGATRDRNAVLAEKSEHTYSHRPAIGVSVQGFRPFLAFERPHLGQEAVIARLLRPSGESAP